MVIPFFRLLFHMVSHSSSTGLNGLGFMISQNSGTGVFVSVGTVFFQVGSLPICQGCHES